MFGNAARAAIERFSSPDSDRFFSSPPGTVRLAPGPTPTIPQFTETIKSRGSELQQNDYSRLLQDALEVVADIHNAMDRSTGSNGSRGPSSISGSRSSASSAGSKMLDGASRARHHALGELPGASRLVDFSTGSSLQSTPNRSAQVHNSPPTTGDLRHRVLASDMGVVMGGGGGHQLLSTAAAAHSLQQQARLLDAATSSARKEQQRLQELKGDLSASTSSSSSSLRSSSISGGSQSRSSPDNARISTTTPPQQQQQQLQQHAQQQEQLLSESRHILPLQEAGLEETGSGAQYNEPTAATVPTEEGTTSTSAAASSSSSVLSPLLPLPPSSRYPLGNTARTSRNEEALPPPPDSSRSDLDERPAVDSAFASPPLSGMPGPATGASAPTPLPGLGSSGLGQQQQHFADRTIAAPDTALRGARMTLSELKPKTPAIFARAANAANAAKGPAEGHLSMSEILELQEEAKRAQQALEEGLPLELESGRAAYQMDLGASFASSAPSRREEQDDDHHDGIANAPNNGPWPAHNDSRDAADLDQTSMSTPVSKRLEASRASERRPSGTLAAATPVSHYSPHATAASAPSSADRGSLPRPQDRAQAAGVRFERATPAAAPAPAPAPSAPPLDMDLSYPCQQAVGIVLAIHEAVDKLRRVRVAGTDGDHLLFVPTIGVGTMSADYLPSPPATMSTASFYHDHRRFYDYRPSIAVLPIPQSPASLPSPTGFRADPHGHGALSQTANNIQQMLVPPQLASRTAWGVNPYLARL